MLLSKHGDCEEGSSEKGGEEGSSEEVGRENGE